MVVEKKLPTSPEVFKQIANQFGTPVYVYDEKGIRQNARRLKKAYSWNSDYKNYFAVKALSTPAILRIIEEEGMGFDCGNANELQLLKHYGLGKNGIFFTANNASNEDYQLAYSMGATIIVDKEEFVLQVKDALGRLPEKMGIRYNPGEVKSGNSIIGDPIKAKFGETKTDVLKALREMKKGSVAEIGLHTMVVSNERNPEYFADTARLLREVIDEAKQEDMYIKFVDIGGGIGINYHPEEEPVDVEAIAQGAKEHLGDLGIPIYSENGRFITGPHGYMITKVTNGIVKSYDKFLQVDTSINNLVRLATVTAAYHHLEILDREDDERDFLTVVGKMCTNTDKMFKERLLPKTAGPGDLLIIYDVGAHSRVNSHNYNFLRRAGEVLIKEDGSLKLIRRHETVEDLFATFVD